MSPVKGRRSFLHVESQPVTLDSDLDTRKSVVDEEIQGNDGAAHHANDSVLDVVDGDEGDMVYLEVKENEEVDGVKKQVSSVTKKLSFPS